MRATLTTASVMAVMVMLTFAFLPQGPPTFLQNYLEAQDADISSDASASSPSDRKEADRHGEDQLSRRFDFDFDDVSLTDALQFTGNQIGLQPHLKIRAIEEIGISGDEPISFSLKNVPVKLALDLILEQLDLTYIVREGVMIVTTVEDLESVGEVRVYNCRDLLDNAASPVAVGVVQNEVPVLPGIENEDKKKNVRRKSKGNGAAAKQSRVTAVSPDVLAQFGGGVGTTYCYGGPQEPETKRDKLIEVITSTVEPDSWDDVGGPGSIKEFDGLLVVRQNPRVHQRIEEMLDRLRECSDEQAWANPPATSSNVPAGFGGGGGIF